MTTLRGVNLGGWLVLEQWMTPELYAGHQAKDEYHLLLEWGEARAEILKKHRDSFITEEDFRWVGEYGLNTVRLPIGHWLFEDKYPYINSLEYVQKAFAWAEKYGLKVMLDVHAASGCQNGFDNGGLSGVVDWPKGDNIQKTLEFIEQLTKEFMKEKSLLGIEVLNEPGWSVDLQVIQKFYLDSYRIIRKYLDENYPVIFHDAFRIEQWEEFFTNNAFVNVMLDTHMYQVFSGHDAKRSPLETIEKVSVQRYREIKEIDFVDLIVGEWSLGLHDNVLKQLDDNFQKELLYRAVGNSLLTTFENSKGWFFWNYRLSEESTAKYVGWSFRDIVAKGYLPNKIEGESK